MPSRRVFKERILREVRGLTDTVSTPADLAAQFALLPVDASFSGTDRVPYLSGATAVVSTGSVIRDYILGISAGTATIPENLTVQGAGRVDGMLTLGGPWQHPEVVTGNYTVTAAHNAALLGDVSIAGDIDVAGTLAILN